MQKTLPKALLLDPSRFNSEALMNDLIKSVGSVCIKKSLVLDATSEPESSFFMSKDVFENVTRWVPFLINTLPERSQFRMSTLQHGGEGYLMITFPVLEIFNDVFSAQSISLSYVLNKLASQVNFVIRQQDHNKKSGYTIRLKLR